jgi:hypothetical protein
MSNTNTNNTNSPQAPLGEEAGKGGGLNEKWINIARAVKRFSLISVHDENGEYVCTVERPKHTQDVDYIVYHPKCIGVHTITRIRLGWIINDNHRVFKTLTSAVLYLAQRLNGRQIKELKAKAQRYTSSTDGKPTEPTEIEFRKYITNVERVSLSVVIFPDGTIKYKEHDPNPLNDDGKLFDSPIEMASGWSYAEKDAQKAFEDLLGQVITVFAVPKFRRELLKQVGRGKRTFEIDSLFLFE